MTDREIKEVLGKGTPSTFSFDPNVKTEITRATLDQVVREIRKHLSGKKKVSVVLVKE